jgi:uncharacterized cupredoxin-like copper-binding protein
MKAHVRTDIRTDVESDVEADVEATSRFTVSSVVSSVVSSAFSSAFSSAVRSALLVVAASSVCLAQDTTITIKAVSSSLEFLPASIAVKQGTRVKLRLVNEGTLPHNFVLPKSEDDIDALAMAAMAEGGDYVPDDMKGKLIAYTALASPGETVEVTFVAPPAGTYTYVCLMSGHAAMMLGTFRSQR